MSPLILMWLYYHEVGYCKVQITVQSIVMWKEWQALNNLCICKLYTSWKKESRLKNQILIHKKHSSLVSIQALALSMWSHYSRLRNADSLVFYKTVIREQTLTDVHSPESFSRPTYSLVRIHMKRVIHEQASGYANTEHNTVLLQHSVTCKRTAVKEQ